MTLRTHSTAVMARRNEPAHGLDFFPTPPWATRAFFKYSMFPGSGSLGSAWDPVCGEGHMALVLEEYPFWQIYRSDVHDYGQPFVADFLEMRGFHADWIFMNPPFNKALAMIEHALEHADQGVAVLARSALLEGQERYRRLYSVRPPCHVFQFVERVPMFKGRWAINGSSATAYSWFVWRTNAETENTSLHFIPPCRQALTKESDYLRFGACSDLPKHHPVMRGRS